MYCTQHIPNHAVPIMANIKTTLYPSQSRCRVRLQKCEKSYWLSFFAKKICAH